MQRVTIPKTAKVGGFLYRIERVHILEDECVGFSCPQESKILLSDKTQSGDYLNQAFLHELLHAIDYVYNNNSLDDDQVERIAHGIYQVFLDNAIFGKADDQHQQEGGGQPGH